MSSIESVFDGYQSKNLEFLQVVMLVDARIANLMRLWLRFRNVGIVLFGHGLTVGRTDEFRAPYHDDFDVLTNAIEKYENWGFEFISMGELLEIANNNFQSDKNWIHLTFDDGFESVYTRAYPYLREKQIPFSVFISTHHIESAERFYGYSIRCGVLNTRRHVHLPGLELSMSVDASKQERMAFGDQVSERFRAMSKSQVVDLMGYIDSLLSPQEWESCDTLYYEDRPLSVSQVRKLADDESVHVGSHNHNHISLNRNVSEEDVVFEMEESRNWLQRNLAANPLTYCYPHGSRDDFTPVSKTICQRLGYELAFVAYSGFISPKTDRFEIPRIGLSMSSHDFQRRLLKFLLPDPVVNVVRSLKTVCGICFPS